MSFTLLSVIIILSGALIVFRQVRVGLKVGLMRSATRLALFLLSAVFSTFISNWLSFIIEDNLNNAVTNLDAVIALENGFGNLHKLTNVLCEAIGAVVIYIPVFFLLFGLFSLIVKIVYHKSVPERDGGKYDKSNAAYHEKQDKNLGAVIGAVSGVLITLTVFMPISGIFKTGERLIDVLSKFSDENTLASDEDDDFNRYADDLMLNVVYSFGGRSLFDMTAVMNGSEISATLRDEIDYLDALDDDVFIKIAEQISRSDKKTFAEVVERSEESVLFEAIAYSVMTNASLSWSEGRDYMGITNPFGSYSAAFNRFTRDLLWVCAVSSPDNFIDNMKTLANVVEIIEEAEDELGGTLYKEQIDALASGDVLDRVRNELEKNPNMKSLVSSVDRIVISILSEEIMSSDKYSEFKRKQLFKNLADAINFTNDLPVEVRIDKVNEYVNKAFTKYNMYLPSGVDRELSETLVRELSYYGNVSQELIRYFFVS